MNSTSCSTCQKSKAPLQCGHCHVNLCKSCAHFLEEDRLSYMKSKPTELSHSVYCGGCFEAHVAPALDLYDALIEKAKNVRVYEKNQGKETRLMKRVQKPIQVVDCQDRQEAFLRLAFLAAGAGFNGIIDVDIKSQKVIENSYQSTRYSGTAVPINLNLDRVVRDRALWDNPN